MFPEAIKRYALLSGDQELAVGVSKRSRHEDIDEGAFLRSDGSTSARESVCRRRQHCEHRKVMGEARILIPQ